MITLENLKEVLLFLGYRNSEDKYIYHFNEFDCNIEVDFRNNKIFYPEDKGLIVNERQTCNLSENENFVVLECVHRLLLKGYKPSHIEIEKRWSLGHSKKSGRADICVMNETGNDMLIIIECKTYGAEFENELKNLKTDGGQLFSYYQQEQSTKWLMLYATGFVDNKLEHQINTISVFDTEEVLEKFIKNKSIKLYDDAHSKEKAFQVWKETYEQKIYEDLIFINDTIAYNIGEKPLRKKDLKEFNPRDKIVNKFEEILRHNNVSDKENAFNKLVALFICKLVDEITKQDNDIVDFQYKFGTDTYETLLDRLQRLYKEGMDKFMKEEIFYVSSEYPLNLFSNYKGQNRKNAINDLKETFRKLKFYSNSDFAFKDVHNEQLFLQNGKILVEVVKLFEKYKIVYSSKHQFLGDLFEQLLNQGFKQNEGQFFTPIPITRFIWESLPIENITKNLKNDKYPKVIDYACGSGHFLTEGIEIINSIIKSENNDWVSEKIYGIEKDYRLARVSKISLFMNGVGTGNIVFGDGLDNYKDKGIINNDFDILVANPPYAVQAFKSHLKLKDNNFEIIDLVSNDGGEIEVLFVERIAQLLKANGVAAVILPAPLLSKIQNSFIEARSILIKNFQLKAIAQFGNKTFGKTGQNTVVLFLQKYKEPPKYFELMEDSISAIFSNKILENWDDNEIFCDYLKHIDVNEDFYVDFLCESKDIESYKDNKYFKVYNDAFLSSTEYKNIISKPTYKKLKKEEQIKKIETLFYNYMKSIEKEKMFYFALVRNQKTLVIKSPDKNTEQYEFLGYQWRNSKGYEGIEIIKRGGFLYDPSNRESNKHLAKLVRHTFNSELKDIDKELAKYATILETKNMLDFERENFDKSIRLSGKYILNSNFELKKLNNVCIFIKNGKDVKQNTDKAKYMVSRIETIAKEKFDFTSVKFTDDLVDEEYFWKKGEIALSHINSPAHLGKTAYFDSNKQLIHGINLLRIKVKEELVLSKFLYWVTKLRYFKKEVLRLCKSSINQSSISVTDLGTIEIPVPPIDIQKEVIDKCQKVENNYENTRMEAEEYQVKIQSIFEELEVIKK